MSYELIELPEGWQLTTVSEAIQIIDYRGRTPPFSSSGIPHLRSSNIRNGQIILDGLVYVSEETYQTYMTRGIPQKGDVLFTTEAPLGEVALAPDYNFSLAQRMMILRPMKELLLSKFLLYQIQSESFQRKLKTSSTGSTVTGVSSRNFQPLELVIPPLNEQKRIVAKIEALRERSRGAREALFEIPGLCDRFRQSVLAAAFRGDLTADWREQNPDVEPASVLLERIKVERRRCWEEKELEKMKAKGKVPEDDKWKSKYKEPAKIDEAELPDLPDGWCWLSADELTSLITDGEHATPERSNDGVYLLSARNVLNGRVSLENVDYVPENVYRKLEERLKVEPGDVFLSCSGTVGRSCVVPSGLKCALVRSVAVLKPLLGMGEYLSLAIRSPYVQSQIERKKTQTAQSNIFQGRIKILAIPVAPLNEQKIIVQAIYQAFNFIESVEQTIQDIESEGTTLDQSILAKAFRGELVPQDPNDEPASVLLERIKAEREQLGEKKKTTRKSPAPRSRKAKTETPTFEQMSIPGLEIPDNRNEQTQK